MELKEKTTSLELSQRLKDLGIQQDGYFKWSCYDNDLKDWRVVSAHDHVVDSQDCSAFISDELGEILPKECHTAKQVRYVDGKAIWEGDYTCWADDKIPGTEDEYPNESGETEAEARGNMLVYLLKNGLISY